MSRPALAFVVALVTACRNSEVERPDAAAPPVAAPSATTAASVETPRRRTATPGLVVKPGNAAGPVAWLEIPDLAIEVELAPVAHPFACHGAPAAERWAVVCTPDLARPAVTLSVASGKLALDVRGARRDVPLPDDLDVDLSATVDANERSLPDHRCKGDEPHGPARVELAYHEDLKRPGAPRRLTLVVPGTRAPALVLLGDGLSADCRAEPLGAGSRVSCGAARWDLALDGPSLLVHTASGTARVLLPCGSEGTKLPTTLGAPRVSYR